MNRCLRLPVMARSPVVGRAALLGMATGSRSTAGVAAVVLSARSGPLARPPVRLAAVAAVGIELVIDKLPGTPSRLDARGLIARAIGGALSGVLLARRDPSSSVRVIASAGAVAAAATVPAAFLGAGWRELADRRWGTDWRGAVAEDLASATVALTAVRG